MDLKTTMHNKSLLALLLLLLLAVLVWYGFSYYTGPAGTAMNTASTSANGAPPSAPSAEVLAQIAKSGGFQALVSYTNQGFEPRHLTLKAGDTVRFVNNSSGKLWVAASGADLYPSEPNGCGSSALDTCKNLNPGEFWEFTFAEKGQWNFVNNAKKGAQGTVTVEMSAGQ